MSFGISYRPFRLVLGSFILATCGCGCDRHDKAEKPKSAATAPESTVTKDKPREPLIKKQEIEDWCPEHGVPESICTRCNSSLIPGFKEKGDWCKEHDLPESQCFVCHPELKARFEAMRFKKGDKPREPLIKKQEIADWCPEHGVPESICTRCNASLIAGFKQKGDWCKEHDLPESQCFICHPELKEKFEAMKPKGG